MQNTSVAPARVASLACARAPRLSRASPRLSRVDPALARWEHGQRSRAAAAAVCCKACPVARTRCERAERARRRARLPQCATLAAANAQRGKAAAAYPGTGYGNGR